MRIAQLATNPTYPALLDAWRYTRHELLYITWALMEIALVAPLALAALPWARYWPAAQVALWLLLIMLIPFNLSRLMSLLRVPVQRQQVVMVAGLLLAILLSLRTLLFDLASPIDLRWIPAFYNHIAESGNPYWGRDVAIFILVTFFWWRGISLVGRRVDMKSLGLRFRISALIFAPIVILIASGLADWNVIPFLLLFFLAGLLAMALTRAEQLEQDKSGKSFAMSPRWLAAVTLAALAIILAGVILASWISGESILGLAGWLQPLWLALYFAATTIIGLLAHLALPFLSLLSIFLQWMVDVIGEAMRRGLQPLTPGTELNDEPLFPELDRYVQLQPEYRSLLIILVMLLAVLVVALALNWIYRQMRPEAERNSELARVRGQDDQEKRPGLVGRLLQQLGLRRGWRAAASVRRIYREMSLVAGAAGYGRGESETPYEYLPTLAKAWPDNQAETSLITRAYVRVRYGEFPESKQELAELEAAWKRLDEKRPSADNSP
jgi:hypothetical protein